MSYEKVQSLSMKKDGTLSVRCASADERPALYATVTVPMRENESLEDRLKYIFEQLSSESWTMNPSNKSLVFYRFLRAIEDVEEGKDIYIQFGRVTFPETDERREVSFREVYDDVFAAFCKQWLRQEKVNVSNVTYGVKMESGSWMHGTTKYGYKHNQIIPKKFPIVRAMMLARLYAGTVHKLK